MSVSLSHISVELKSLNAGGTFTISSIGKITGQLKSVLVTFTNTVCGLEVFSKFSGFVIVFKSFSASAIDVK